MIKINALYDWHKKQINLGDIRLKKKIADGIKQHYALFKDVKCIKW